MITKEHITIGLRKNGDLLRPAINKDAEIHLSGRRSIPRRGRSRSPISS